VTDLLTIGDEISVRGGPTTKSASAADPGRAGFLDKLQALDGQLRRRLDAPVLRRRLDAPVSPKMPVFIFGSVSINPNVIFI
jgi:hypothetical protein